MLAVGTKDPNAGSGDVDVSLLVDFIL